MFGTKLSSTSLLYELYIHVMCESSDSSGEFAHVPEPSLLVDDVHVSAEICTLANVIIIQSWTKGNFPTSGMLYTSMHFRIYKTVYFISSGQHILMRFVPFESNMNKAILFLFKFKATALITQFFFYSNI